MDQWEKVAQADGTEAWVVNITFNQTYDPVELKVFEASGTWQFQITHPDVEEILTTGTGANLDDACAKAFDAVRGAAQSVLDQFQ